MYKYFLFILLALQIKYKRHRLIFLSPLFLSQRYMKNLYVLVLIFATTLHLWAQRTEMNEMFDSEVFPTEKWTFIPSIDENVWKQEKHPSNVYRKMAISCSNYKRTSSSFLISRKIAFTKADNYILEFQEKISYSGEPQFLRIHLLSQPNPKNVIQTLADFKLLSNFQEFELKRINFSPYSNDSFYIAFECYTNGNQMGSLILDNILLKGCNQEALVSLSRSPSWDASPPANLTFAWSSVCNAAGYTISYGDNAPDFNNLAKDLDLGNINTHTPKNLIPDKSYGWAIRAYNSSQATIFASDINPFKTEKMWEYCSCASASQDFAYISEVRIGAFYNNDDKADFFKSYGNAPVPCVRKDSISFSINLSNSNKDEYISLFADWNFDGDFKDAGEYVLTGETKTGEFKGRFYVPENAKEGLTKIRIKMGLNAGGSSPKEPCEAFYMAGETEDYQIFVK